MKFIYLFNYYLFSYFLIVTELMEYYEADNKRSYFLPRGNDNSREEQSDSSEEKCLMDL